MFRSLVEGSPDAIIAHRDGLVLYANPAAAALLGVAGPDALVGRDIFSFVHPDFRNLARFRVAVLKQGAVSIAPVEMTVVRADGTPVVIEARARPIDVDGTPAVQSVLRDVSERHEAEARLRRAQQNLTFAQRIANLGSWEFDLAGGAMDCSPQIYRLLDRDSRRGGPPGLDMFLSAVSFEDRPRVTAALQALVRGEARLDIEHRIVLHDGSERFIHHQAEAVRDGDGRPVRLRGALQDVTELRFADAALRESEERLALAVRGANDAIWDWRLADGSFYHSPRLPMILGYGEGERRWTRGDWLARIHPDNREKQKDRLDRHLTGEAAYYSCEYQVRNRAGDYVWVLDRGVALRGDGGNITRLAGSIGDVTQRRLAEDRLRHTQKMEALGRLAGGVAHEFNNLLVGIGGFASMGRERLDDRDRVRLCLDEVIVASERAGALTRQLLTFSRKQVSHPRRFRPAAEIEGLARFLRSLLGSRVTLEIVPDAPDAHVEMDPAHLSQVVTNLAINARDAMPDGGPLVVRTRVVAVDGETAARFGRGRGDYVCIAVSDAGTGIAPEALPRLFEPFFTTKEPGHGTGLGLPLVLGMVEQADGFLRIDSKTGRGTTVEVLLPLKDAGPVADGTAAAAETGPATGGTVLVVDDEPTIRTLARAALGDAGYDVLTAENGRRALEAWEHRTGLIDALVTDVTMPDMDGPELARRLLAVAPGLPVVFMSALARPSDPPLPAPARFLPKPFGPEALRRIVHEVLKQRNETV